VIKPLTFARGRSMMPTDLVVAALGFLVWTIKVTIHRTQIAGPRVSALYDILLAGLWTNIVQGQRACRYYDPGIGTSQDKHQRGEVWRGSGGSIALARMSFGCAILSM